MIPLLIHNFMCVCIYRWVQTRVLLYAYGGRRTIFQSLRMLSTLLEACFLILLLCYIFPLVAHELLEDYPPISHSAVGVGFQRQTTAFSVLCGFEDLYSGHQTCATNIFIHGVISPPPTYKCFKNEKERDVFKEEHTKVPVKSWLCGYIATTPREAWRKACNPAVHHAFFFDLSPIADSTPKPPLAALWNKYSFYFTHEEGRIREFKSIP